MSWKTVKLGDILKRRRETIKVLPDQEYKLVTIKLYHKGVVLRNISKGSEIKSPMSSIKAGDFILSGIDARNGAFGIVPDELEGAIITNDFWCLDPDESLIEKEFLLFLTSTDFFDHICKQSSDGTTQRIRLQKDKFFNFQIDLPTLEEQKLLTSKFKTLELKNSELSTELTHQLDLVKQLRQSFLREAMQGKLVAPTHDGETGQQLLAQIKAEKAQLIADKKLKKEKDLPPIKAEDIPFAIPKHWTWCRLGETSINRLGKMLDATKNKGLYYPYLRNLNVQWHSFILNDILQMKFEEHELEEYSVKKGDLLICEGGEPGRAAIWESNDESFKFQKALHRVRFLANVPAKFYLFYLEFLCVSKKIQDYFTGSGIQHFTGKSLNLLTIPLPPLSEQRRIVEKLESLMQTCDALEASIKNSQLQNQQLLQQVLREALKR
ncbi:hypothetical protein GVN20_14540 [Runella sp. CRIBMP]|uniref:restriction endonuclease subunit S n=1 Tax=Runella sp. CRIBMP TaxID=2683261 RepID=UPI001412B5DB|nr:restriction endonuclease subunit S [Runella sp. CRIBMP]NBB20581.1 hypothetical protein [Runella sp. CRIBMP]